MKYECYFCHEPTMHRGNYYGCVHSHKSRGKMHVRHFYANTGGMNFMLHEVIWNFKYKRRNYEMLYKFTPYPAACLYRRANTIQMIARFPFIPTWTPDNCREKINKVLAFA